MRSDSRGTARWSGCERWRAACGATVGDTLPLDELSRHSAIALPVYLSVWALAGLLFGLLAHWARIERLTAAMLLALGVGVWGYLTTGVSLLIVRQVPAHDAFHA